MEQQRAVHESPKRMWASKLTLRIISTVLDLILIGVSASLGTNWSSPAIIFFLPPVRPQSPEGRTKSSELTIDLNRLALHLFGMSLRASAFSQEEAAEAYTQAPA
jgi:hypothetical protein